jgi:dihydrofolate reductase
MQTGPDFADPINRLPKYIASTTVQNVDWNNCHFFSDVAKDVTALKKTEGGNILVYGSATLVRALLHHDLVDELRLMVFPVSIGGGIRIFDDNREMTKFMLRHCQAIDNNIVILEYQPVVA